MIPAHHNLDAWKNSMELAKSIYEITARFPDAERFGLVSQMRRAAVSIPSNIAEGAARGSDGEFIRFLNIARGSLAELQTQVLLARDLGFMPDSSTAESLIDDISRQLNGLIKHVRARTTAQG
jgi:four helix bundle protein